MAYRIHVNDKHTGISILSFGQERNVLQISHIWPRHIIGQPQRLISVVFISILHDVGESYVASDDSLFFHTYYYGRTITK